MKKLQPKYRQTTIYAILLMVAVIMLCLVKFCSTPRPLSARSTGGSGGDTIDVGILYGPSSFYIYEDTLGGINYDILRIMKQELTHPVKLWPVSSLEEGLSQLHNSQFRMLASLPSDYTVKSNYLTSPSVFLDRLVLVQLADSSGVVKINSVLDLGTDTIYIPADSPAVARLNNLSNEIDCLIPVKETTGMTEEYLCMKVASSDIKLAVVNEKVAKKMKSTYPQLSFDNPISFTQFQVWIMEKKDSLLMNEVNAWLEDFKQSPDYRALISRY